MNENIKVSPEIFRMYDIRGIVGKDLNEKVFELIGKAFGSILKKNNKKTVIVGRDNRLSSESLANSLINGFQSTGLNVINIGLVPTPAYYYSLIALNADGGAMVTASHNPANFNGVKLNNGTHTLFGNEIKQVLKVIQEKNFFETVKGSLSEKNVLDLYKKMILEKISLNKNKSLKVVLDCGNAVPSIIAPQILKELGVELIELFCEPDGSFPNHHPDPVIPENLKELIKTVKKEKADLGIALDGDGDRIGVIDNNGRIVFGDQLLTIFARDLLKKRPKEKILVEVKCSQGVIEDIKKHNGIAVFCRTGHSFIKAKLLEENALLAGEMSGHMFFRDEFFGFDDAIYAACRLLRILSNTVEPLSSIVDSLPKYFSSPEIRIECNDKEKFKIVDEMVKEFKKEFNVLDIDGARVLFGDGWGLIRASNTQPAIILRFEAKTLEKLEEIKKLFKEKLSRFKSINLNKI
jgi:phosphomannomutase/phosphoglucomutase